MTVRDATRRLEASVEQLEAVVAHRQAGRRASALFSTPDNKALELELAQLSADNSRLNEANDKLAKRVDMLERALAVAAAELDRMLDETDATITAAR